MRKLYAFYIALVFIVLALPAVLLPFYKSGWKSETSSLAKAPALADEDGSLNMELLGDAGAWFEDHFAFRPELITADARLQNTAFGTSASSKIINGKNGWLYFKAAVKDYQGTEPFSDRALYNVAHNLKLMQDYYGLLGMDMLFFIAPDKSTLYPENLPYYIKKGEGRSNAERLKSYLETEGVKYADMFEAFENNEEVLYYATDTHWNNKGAAFAFDVLMEQLGETDAADYGNVLYSMSGQHQGDLAEMLYPSDPGYEEDAVYEIGKTWDYEGEVKDPMDEFIKTSNPAGNGSVYMFRDSFGSALIPFFAQQYASAAFSRLTPYNVSDPFINGAQTVLIERAERNIKVLAAEAPIMQNPVREVSPGEIKETDTTCGIFVNGGFYVIRGAIDPEYFNEDTGIYEKITEQTADEAKIMEAFYLSEDGNDRLYQVNILNDPADTGIKNVDILIKNGEKIYQVASCVIDKSENYEKLTFEQGEE